MTQCHLLLPVGKCLLYFRFQEYLRDCLLDTRQCNTFGRQILCHYMIWTLGDSNKLHPACVPYIFQLHFCLDFRLGNLTIHDEHWEVICKKDDFT